MAPDTKPAATANDTSFRKTWDRASYAAKASEREASEKLESKARLEAKLQGKKYIPRPATPPDAKAATSRTSRLSVADNVGKVTIVPAGAAVGKRGKGAGFYCEECDLTFKDNLQFVEHLNSRQHLVNIGEKGEVSRAGVEEVRERLAWLREKQREAEWEKLEGGMKVEERVGLAKEREEREREEKREKRREKRKKARQEVRVKEEEGTVGAGIIC